MYVYNNYTYCRDNRYDHIYWCSKRRTEKCSAVLEKEGESYTLKHGHNHSEKQYIVEIHKMKKEMVHLCKETTESFRHIFNTVSRNNFRVAPYISYNGIKSILGRYRAKSRSDIPADLHSLHEQLKTYIPTQSIYKGCAISIDNKIALIFSNDVLLNVLSEACEIFVDGTFSVICFFIYFKCLNYFLIYIYKYQINIYIFRLCQRNLVVPSCIPYTFAK